MRRSLTDAACARTWSGIARDMRRAVLLMVLLAVTLGLPGCGENAREAIRQRTQELRHRVEGERDRIRARIEEVLGKLERAIPQAQRTSPQFQSRGRTSRQTIDQFLTAVLQSIDAYWRQTLTANGLVAPSINAYWV